MEKSYLNLLENIEELDNIESINQIYQNLLNELRFYLNLENCVPKVKIIFNKRDNPELKDRDIFNIGVKRTKNDFLIIEIFNSYKKFLPIILLREALMCFVPNMLVNNETIKIIINQIVMNDLEKLKVVKEWDSIFKEKMVNYDFLRAEFDRLEKFFKLKKIKKFENPTQFFFKYIRKHVLLIDENKENFYHNLFKEFVLRSSKFMYNDEIIETIRVLIKIFYKVKSYRALLDFQNYFKDFKQNGEIQTYLSLRKFTANLQWINNNSYIAPSYQINLSSINAGVIFCILTFNPILNKAQIDIIVEELPFFYMSKSSESYFTVEISGWFIFPQYYLKDLRNFLDKLERFGFVIKKTCFLNTEIENFLNLNYFREFYRIGSMINPKHIEYEKSYEINFKFDLENTDIRKVSILDSIILNRIYNWSPHGFSFVRRTETLRTIKSDLINEILSQTQQIKKLKKNIGIFHNDLKLKKEFLQFLNTNQRFGFFYIKNLLVNILASLKLIRRIISRNSDIKNIYQFQEFFKKKGISQSIDKNNLFINKELNRFIYQDFLPIYFNNREEFNLSIKKYQFFRNFLKYCNRLKIFDLRAIKRIIEDKNVVEQIYAVKQQKLRDLHQNYRLKNITIKTIDDILDSFSNKELPVIKPLLINTINTTNFAKYFIQIVLKDNPKVRDELVRIKKYFPRVYLESGVNLFGKEKLIMVHIYLPNINGVEKKLFISILNNTFGEDLLSLKRYFFDGFNKSVTISEYLDVYNQDYFYTKDLFEQYFIYVQKIFGKELKSFKETTTTNQTILWSRIKDFRKLIEKNTDRSYNEQIEFSISKLNKLADFYRKLEEILLDREKLIYIKKEDFFKKYVKSIKFKPAFHSFGFGQYYLYIRPTDMNEIDFKLLFNNTFQKIRYPAFIDNVQSLFVKMIFPHRNPNMAYINWLTKAKKIISEYCIFYVKKFYILFRFDKNLDPIGWDLDANSFKAYMQKVLFDPSFNRLIPKVSEHNIGDLSISNYYGPDSDFYQKLTDIYSTKPIDLKTFLGGLKRHVIEKIKDLLKNKLIYPYIKLKNLDFQDKIYIILPSVKKDQIETIVKVFSFFNYGFIYETEGEYFIKGFDDVIKFENGLMIKLYFPLAELSYFQKVFNQLFQFLGIDKYLILNDMIDGRNLIRAVHGDFIYKLDKYNPLKNLGWNKRDKKWKNHKLYGENFEPIYPKMFPYRKKEYNFL